MAWVLSALLFTVLTAVQTESNRHFKVNGTALNFGRTLTGALFCLPLIPWMAPLDRDTFLAVAVTSVAMSVGTSMMLSLSGRQHSKAAGLVFPLKFIVLFLLWPLFDLSALQRLLSDPWQLLGLAALFTVAWTVWAGMRAGRLSLKMLLPPLAIALIFTSSDIVLKKLGGEALKDLPVVLSALLVGTGLTALLSFPALMMSSDARSHLSNKRFWRASSFLGVLILFRHASYFYAICHASSPAYVSIVVLLVPVFMMLYHRFRHIQDDFDPHTAWALVLCSFVFVFLSQR